MLTPTYASAMLVDEDEAHDRLAEALRSAALVEDLQRAIRAALERKLGPRTRADELLDRISAGIGKRGGSLRSAPASPAVAAVMVRINVEVGLAPEPMRATLATPRGAAVLEAGFAELGAHLVKELTR